ncbi:MAG: hypothetical protein A4E19_12260 [Nitrospira sp. SG-bin1]|nr:MAG: hypothetical protein A4E19_12260 [Nitrospira sp. SG-bin1]
MLLNGWIGFWWWFESLKLQLTVLQGLDEALNDREALSEFGLVRCPKFEVSIGLEFLRSLPEGETQALAKLQLGFTLCGIPVGEAFLAEILDRRKNFLELGNTKRGFFDQRVF